MELSPLDPWSAVAYKFPSARGTLIKAPWMNEADGRRLSAYYVLAAYDENVARTVSAAGPGEDTGERREYGDPSLIVEQAMTHTLGEDQQIMVEGAATHDPDDVDAGGGPDEEAQNNDPEAVTRWRVQEALRTWAKDENFLLRMLDAERKAHAMGDAVYLLEWDDDRMRPRLTVMDPGFYFPVLPDGLNADGYPTKVHFAWEEPGENFPDRKARLRRVTYELGTIVNADGVPMETPTRKYAWEDKASNQTCYLTDATWILGDARGGAVDLLTMDKATYRVTNSGETLNRLDLHIDFIPVVHLPNTHTGAQHFGQSVIAKALQVLDDLQGADTDAAAASATTGTPPIGMTGASAQQDALVVRPGDVWELGPDGRLFTVNTAPQLAELRNYVQHLQDRVSRNTRLPDVALGIRQTDAGSSLSGVALTIRYGPLEGLVRGLRAVREPKYRLLFRFVQRFLMLNPEYPAKGASGVYEARMAFGTFLPRDLKNTIDAVRAGVEGRVISLETGVIMLQAAGVPSEDIADEVRAIEARMFREAVDLAEAAGDAGLARQFLGRGAAAPATPVVTQTTDATDSTAPDAPGTVTVEA